eukprot:Pgem_evm1s17602
MLDFGIANMFAYTILLYIKGLVGKYRPDFLERCIPGKVEIQQIKSSLFFTYVR